MTGARLVQLHTHEPVVSGGAAAFLDTHDASLAVAAGGRLWLFTEDADGRPAALELGLDDATALCWHEDRLWVATGWQLWAFVDTAPATGTGDAHLLLPQTARTTGGLGVSDVAVATGGPLLVSGLLTCLATPDERFSMRPVWVPPGVDALRPDSRWLLTGVALRAGLAAFVSAAGRSGEDQGWRDGLHGGGLVVDVAGEVVVTGLSVPRHPRWHDGHLVVADSGTGRLLSVDPVSGASEVVTVLPGTLGGLTVSDGVALVGHGDPEEAAVGGLTGGPAPDGRPVRETVSLVDLSTGSVTGTIEFLGHAGPVTSLAVLPGLRRVALAAPRGTVSQTTVVVAEGRKLGIRGVEVELPPGFAYHPVQQASG